MCQQCPNKEPLPFAGEKKFRLADFFNAHWDEYCQHPTKFIEPEQYKAVNAIRVCRTEVLGVDYYVCMQCGQLAEVRHNCKHRFCPTCSWLDTMKWAANVKSQILNIPHRHVVFTLPHDLIPLYQDNRRNMLNILARTSAETFKNWIRHKYGLNPGVISVIHTFGEKKNLHLHIHMIVSWGGIDIKTGELKTIEEQYVNYNHLQKKFRCLFQDDLVELFDKEELKHHFGSRIDFMRFLKKINKNNWQIHLEPPMQTPEEVIRYIGRYSKRACLSEYKITNIDGDYITFTYKDYKDREDENNPQSKAIEKPLRLHYKEFFPILLQHVPLPNFPLVRYYGCYGRFKNIPQEYKTPLAEEDIFEQMDMEYQENQNNPKYCGDCQCEKVYLHTLIDIRPKKERTEKFDIQKHKHLIYNKIFISTRKQIYKKAA